MVYAAEDADLTGHHISQHTIIVLVVEFNFISTSFTI